MSYDIITSIGIKSGKVFVSSYCSNITPKRASRWEAESLTKILQEKGKDELDRVILFEFWKGNFQGKSTKYGKFIEIIFDRKASPFKWGNVGEASEVGSEKYGEKIIFTNETLKAELFVQYLKFLEQSKSKEQFKLKINGAWIYKLKRASLSTCYSVENASIFNLAKLQEIKKRFSSHLIEEIAI